LVFIIRIYHNARSSECQITGYLFNISMHHFEVTRRNVTTVSHTTISKFLIRQTNRQGCP